MKKLLPCALWACLALSLPTNAQSDCEKQTSFTSDENKDTIIINPSPGIKFILIGKNTNDLELYNNLDSVKALFLNDIETATQAGTYPTTSKVTYYFIHPNGKRRLKAENEDYIEPVINVQKELRSMSLELPPYEYIIYALGNDYEFHIHIKDPKDLSKISAVNLKDALAAALEDKKIIKQSTKIEIEKTNEHWVIKDHSRDKTDLLELTPAFGMSLIGSRWSPMAAFNLSIILDDKYGDAYIKTGLTYSVNSFADWSSEKFTNLNIVATYGLRYMMRVSGTKKGWLGLQGGYMKSYEKEGPLHDKYKVGITAEGFGAFNFDFDVIFLGSKQSIYGLTLKVPF